MKLPNYILLLVCMLIFATQLNAQSNTQYNAFTYQRKLADTLRADKNNSQYQWRILPLTDSILNRVENPYSEVRILAMQAQKDTTECPFMVRVVSDSITTHSVPFNIINNTSTEQGRYITFVLNKSQSINQIDLDFSENNFDWRIQLEGSNNQQQWFTILNNYRVLSINNTNINYQYAQLCFPESQYQYFRLFIPTTKTVTLNSAIIQQTDTIHGAYKTYNPSAQSVSINNTTKQTIIDVTLPLSVPISVVHIPTNTPFDFYRPIRFEAITDSIKTQTGWHYTYSTLFTGVISSQEKPVFSFNSTKLRSLRITIDNHNNQPIAVGAITLRGNIYQLVTRIPTNAEWYLLYGNANATFPQYDISYFTNVIPDVLPALQLGNELVTIQAPATTNKPLFANSWWLWGIIIIVVVTLGYFTLTMIKKI